MVELEPDSLDLCGASHARPNVCACTKCSTHGAIANGAAFGADRDGTPLVHRPGVDEPVPAVFHEADSNEDHHNDRFTLDEVDKRISCTTSTEHCKDEAFGTLVAK